jgi:hypothetical protein
VPDSFFSVRTRAHHLRCLDPHARSTVSSASACDRSHAQWSGPASRGSDPVSVLARSLAYLVRFLFLRHRDVQRHKVLFLTWFLLLVVLQTPISSYFSCADFPLASWFCGCRSLIQPGAKTNPFFLLRLSLLLTTSEDFLLLVLTLPPQAFLPVSQNTPIGVSCVGSCRSSILLMLCFGLL